MNYCFKPTQPSRAWVCVAFLSAGLGMTGCASTAETVGNVDGTATSFEDAKIPGDFVFRTTREVVVRVTLPAGAAAPRSLIVKNVRNEVLYSGMVTAAGATARLSLPTADSRVILAVGSQQGEFEVGADGSVVASFE